MGPRWLDRGKRGLQREDAVAGEASMGPRWLDRGKRGLRREDAVAGEASMGPRWLDRGKAVPSVLGEARSARFNGAAVVRPRKAAWAGAGSEHGGRASMGPRWLDRGKP